MFNFLIWRIIFKPKWAHHNQRRKQSAAVMRVLELLLIMVWLAYKACLAPHHFRQHTLFQRVGTQRNIARAQPADDITGNYR